MRFKREYKSIIQKMPLLGLRPMQLLAFWPVFVAFALGLSATSATANPSTTTNSAKNSCAAFLESETAQSYLRLTKHLVDNGELSLEELKWLSQAPQAVAPRRLNGEAQEVIVALEAYGNLAPQILKDAWLALKSELQQFYLEKAEQSKETMVAKEDTTSIFYPHVIERREINATGRLASLVTTSGQLAFAHLSRHSQMLTASIGTEEFAQIKIQGIFDEDPEIFETRSGRILIKIKQYLNEKQWTIFEYADHKLTELYSDPIKLNPNGFIIGVALAENARGEIMLVGADKEGNLSVTTFLTSGKDVKQIKMPHGLVFTPKRIGNSAMQLLFDIRPPESDGPLYQVLILDVNEFKEIKAENQPQITGNVLNSSLDFTWAKSSISELAIHMSPTKKSTYQLVDYLNPSKTYPPVTLKNSKKFDRDNLIFTESNKLYFIRHNKKQFEIYNFADENPLKVVSAHATSGHLPLNGALSFTFEKQEWLALFTDVNKARLFNTEDFSKQIDVKIEGLESSDGAIRWFHAKVIYDKAGDPVIFYSPFEGGNKLYYISMRKAAAGVAP